MKGDKLLEDTKRLLRTGRPKEDESFMGYIIRLTEQNAYPTPSWVFSLAGLPPTNINHSSFSFALHSTERVSGLSRITGVGIDELARLVYPRALTSGRVPCYEFFGIPLHQYVIRPMTAKICPECLRESPYCRRVWEMALVTACPKHQCQLVDECPRCKRLIPLIRKGVSICSCGYDWQDCPAPAVGEHGVALSRQIHLLCGLNVGADIPPSTAEQSPASALGLRELVSAVIFITGQYQGLSGATGKKIAPGRNTKELHDLFTKAYSVFESWPDNYYEFLDWRLSQARKRATPQNRSAAGIYRDFGSFYVGLYRHLSSGDFEFLREEFGKYLLSRWEDNFVPSANRWKLPHSLRGGDRYVSRVEARRLLGLNYKLIDHLIEAGKLKASVLDGGGNRLFLIEASSIAALKCELDQSTFPG